MKFRCGRPVLWTLITASGLSAVPVNADAQDRVPGLVSNVVKLSDDSYMVRQTAYFEVWKLGETALPVLQQAAEGEDPETAIRARNLVRMIELGVLPDSSPAIIAQVEKYDKGTKEDRQAVIRELRKLHAYRQILKLYALEKDRETLAMLEAEVHGVALDAARECLVATPSDVASAFEYLKMARPEPAEYMAMASLHRTAGTLDQAIADSAEKGDHMLRFCLLATAGRLEDAAAEADLAGMDQAGARLRMLAGNPLSWIASAPVPPQMPATPGLSLYREISAAMWQGKDPDPASIAELRRLARSGDVEDQAKALMLLFLSGDHQEAEDLLAKRFPTAAFTHFEAKEDVNRALRILGIDPEKPDYTEWVRKRFRVFLEAPDSEQEEIGELKTLGSFLERRGLYRELDEAFGPPLAELAVKNQEDFLMKLTQLFPQGPDDHTSPVVRPVLKAVAAYGGEDEMRWVQAVEHLFDNYGSPAQMWNWIASLEPDMSRPARLELLCRVHRVLPDPDGQRDVFLDKTSKAIEKAEKIERKRLVEMMVGTLSASRDVELFMRCLVELETTDRNRISWDRIKGDALMTQGKWTEAAKLWLDSAAADPGDPFYRAYAAACLRRTGDEAGAAEQEAKADFLSLGETLSLFQCGYAFAATGDFKRAREWWQRAASQCTTDSGTFSKVIYQLAAAACSDGDWKAAAPLHEAFLLDLAIGYDKSAYSASLCQKSRVEGNLIRGFAKLGDDRDAALKIIIPGLDQPYAETVLADYFFAPMRAAGLVELHDAAFEKHWKEITTMIERFPACENTRNSAAWLASRANRRLDEAEKLLAETLETNPHQAAYLDTMAEIHFARGDREKALEFSARGLKEEPDDLQLVRQYQRFKSSDFPPK
ncbi:tetratricopeptide repeat protein [Luteolibacter sp. Populi]|uniref:tetratricopeptide repeat protein n=1 Tax=Luteolibacter sp. Populi TaxID=3230487 RepID=UPI0034662130